MARRLETYRARRDFGVTPEPPPGTRRPEVRGALFMVHKHDATRLHYDLRLEIDGALASWAIPKGPSYDPSERRLAVETEDHPLAYGDFEGRIPDEEYGGGDSLIWDRGTYRTDPPGQESAQRRKGHLRIRLEGEKLQGLWHLVRTRAVGGKQQWLLFKARDEAARPGYDVLAERPESVVSGRRVTRGPARVKALRGRHPPPVELLARVWPPLAVPAASAQPDDDAACEVKCDGVRAVVAISGGRVAMQSREAHDLSQRYPELVAALAPLRIGEVVIDGEVAAFDRAGRTRLELLAAGKEPRFVAFDLLWLEGEDLRARPWEERRELLESVLANADSALILAERLEGPPERALAEARARGLEGIVLKRRGAPYVPGAWVRVDATPTQDVVIAGFEPSGAGRTAGLAALRVAVRDGEGLRACGRVPVARGAAIASATRVLRPRALRQLLEPLRLPGPAVAGTPRGRGVVWVEPALVAEVAFAGWTPAGALRQPKLLRVREDKRPEACVREEGALVASAGARGRAEPARRGRRARRGAHEPRAGAAEPAP